MRNLTLTPAKAPTLNINGKTFEVQVNDVAIMDMAGEVKEKYSRLSKGKHPPGEVLSAAREVAECIDKILGDGAVAAISQGKPVSVALAMEWLGAISTAAIEEYAGELEQKYE